MQNYPVRGVAVVTASLSLAALGLWIGGLVTLGAVVAPIVFHVVPAPTSADAMTLVFRRFDKVAMVCAIVVLSVEVVGAGLRRGMSRVDAARAFAATVAGGAAVYQAVALSPKIAGLHENGAIRGLGEAGQSLEAIHRMAEITGKVQALFGLLVLILHVAALASLRRAPGNPNRA